MHLCTAGWITVTALQIGKPEFIYYFAESNLLRSLQINNAITAHDLSKLCTSFTRKFEIVSYSSASDSDFYFRPPDIHVGGLMLYHGFFFFFFFSSATLRARWTELNENRPHTRKWVQFENACQNLRYPPTNWGPKTTFFDDFTT